MGRPEYSGHVHGTGLRPLPIRPTSHSFASTSSLSQDAALVSQINSMTAQMQELQEEKRIMNERTAAQDQVIADMKKMIENLAAFNAAAGNTSAAQDTESPIVVSVRSSVASRPG